MDNGELIIENARGRVLGCLILSVIPAEAGIQDLALRFLMHRLV